MNNHRSRIFQARFLNQPTVFIGSNTAVRELLHDKYNCFRMGYKDFFHQIYGNSLLFSDGLEAEELRQSLHDLFQPASTSLNEHSVQIDRFAEEAVETMLSKDYILVYEHFKQVTTQLCLSLFLGLDHSLSVDLMKELCELSTVHWHGMISVPLSLSLPWLVSSGFSKALHAKEQLLKIIKKRLQTAEDGFPARIKTALQSEDAEQNLLLFISALVPKALSSLLTSFICCSHLWCHEPLIKNGELDVSLLECILLEVMRIWPPFIGGRRVAIMECTIGGFHIPKNYAVIYLAHAAHLDPEAFPQPESFLPARWKDCSDSDKEKLYCFGGGPRNCIGQHLVWTILKMAALEMKFAPGHIREQR
ncbi:PREDICTED: putative cytochrome P450 120 isoform X2 [Priapulus caudatus]|uniref:Cytochrome P450 120 isoform X2 n=1 Tax=Priapulus caudatus TaxID=37621 RepID=A0ABM1F8Q6_PRICU|nr:PREDICTED: putative cytochrome P450 120 isoform X2 [Priapulus caudatus]